MHHSNLGRADLNLLILFASLVETRSVTRTAQGLNLSQPAVSHALARLRQLFDDKLFVRTSTGLVLTPRAEELVSPIQSTLVAIEGLMSVSGFDPATTTRRFRVASSDYGAMAVVPPVAECFFSTAPNAGLEINHFTADTERDLEVGKIDLALYGNEPPRGRFRSLELFRESFSCVVRCDHPLVLKLRRRRISIDDYTSWRHALVSIHGGRSGVIDQHLDRIGKPRKIEFWTPYFLTAPMVVAQSDLILTVPTRLADQFSALLGLVRIELPIEVPEYGYFVVWHERSENDQGVGWLRELIAKAGRAPERVTHQPARARQRRR